MQRTNGLTGIIKLYERGIPRYKRKFNDDGTVIGSTEPEEQEVTEEVTEEVTTEETEPITTPTEETTEVEESPWNPEEPKSAGNINDPVTRWGSSEKAPDIKTEPIIGAEYTTPANVRYQINKDGTVTVGDRFNYPGGELYSDEEARYTGEALPIKAKFFSDPGYMNAILDAQLVRESWLIPNLISSAGAKGIAQFMDPTWNDAIKNGWVPEGASPFNPKHAIPAQRELMKSLYNDYSFISNAPTEEERIKRTLAAYNWGSGNVQDAVLSYGADWEQHIPEETEKYLKEIFKRVNDSTQTGEYTPYYIR